MLTAQIDAHLDTLINEQVRFFSFLCKFLRLSFLMRQLKFGPRRDRHARHQQEAEL